MNKEEQKIQMQIVELLSYHAYRNKFIFYSIPNEGLMKTLGLVKDKSIIAKIMNILKKTGLTPGVSDLAIVKNGKTYFMEVKKKDGRLSEDQKKFINNSIKAGAIGSVVYSFDEAKEKLTKWRII